MGDVPAMTAEPVKIKVNHNDLMALYDAHPRKTGGTTVRSRRAGEKRPLSSTDGRRQRPKKRDKQFNTNVTQEVWDLVEDLIERHDLTKAEFTERAFLHFAEALKAGKANGGGTV
jgi:hypothetical protein